MLSQHRNLNRILFFVDRFIDFAHSVVSYDAIIDVDDTANVFGGCVDVEIEYFANEYFLKRLKENGLLVWPERESMHDCHFVRAHPFCSLH